jgi:hypothetical protein
MQLVSGTANAAKVTHPVAVTQELSPRKTKKMIYLATKILEC